MAKKTPQARKASAGKASKTASPAKPRTKTAPKPAKSPAKPSAKGSPKPEAKAAAKASAAKPAAKPASKPPAKPAPRALPAAKGAGSKHTPAKTTAGSKAAIATQGKGAPVSADDKKGGRKGITVVDAKSASKKAKVKEKVVSVAPPSVGRLLDPKNPTRRPLIPSGPKAAHIRPLGMQGPEEERPVVSGKSPFGKRELAHFRQILVRKRAELVGDVSQMENEALQGNSGATSVPQHMAEQGSDTYDQSLALDIAAADRKLIKEIDDAIKRIDTGTFGICELTGKPIKIERLEELPWARYSIEAARELERRSMWV